MRILYLHQYFRSPQEGGGTRSWEFSRAWAREGHQVTVITSDQRGDHNGWKISSGDGVEVHQLSVPYSQQMGSFKRMRAWARFAISASIRARRFKPEVIYATSTPLTIIIPALVAKYLRSTPIVFEVRDLWPDVPVAMGKLNNPLLKVAAQWLERIAYRNSSTIITISQAMKASIESKGVAPTKVVSVPQGCDTQIFFGADCHRIKQEHPWIRNGYVVLYAGTLGRVHGVDYLLQLAKTSLDLELPTRFVCVGDGSEKSRMMLTAAQDGTSGNNLMFAGHLPKQQVAEWYAVASVSLVLIDGPSILWKDAAQNKFWDSIAAGVPVALNKPSWQASFALQHEIGIQLDQDLRASAFRLYEAMNDERWLHNANVTCKSLAFGEYNRERMASIALDVLTEVTATKGAET